MVAEKILKICTTYIKIKRIFKKNSNADTHTLHTNMRYMCESLSYTMEFNGFWLKIMKENPFRSYSTWELCIRQSQNESIRKKRKSNYYPRWLLWNCARVCLCVVQEKCISCNNVTHIWTNTPRSIRAIIRSLLCLSLPNIHIFTRSFYCFCLYFKFFSWTFYNLR